MSHLLRAFALVVALIILPGSADAQKRCVKGKPCGNTCIAQSKTCRTGTSSVPRATPAPRTAPPLGTVTVPEGARFIASSRGRVYYWAGCSAWKSLAPGNLRFFETRQAVETAGYTPSRSRGCAGPATVAAAPTQRAVTSGPAVGTDRWSAPARSAA